jgi:glutathione S-transferase
MTKRYDFNGGEPLTAYVADVSYFSGKLEAFLRYKEIPYTRRAANVNTLLNEVYANTGMMKMPAVRLHDGKWLKDTTPMLQWFDQKKPAYSIYPEDPATNFIALLIEDYADEWCWRSALYWRWCFPETRALLGNRIGQEILGDWPIPNRLAGWYIGERQIRTYLKGDGLTRKTEPFVKNHYLDMLESMQGILSDSPYLLGAKPSIADFGLFGPMFRHFGLDPAPAQVMIEKAPAVYEWLARLWNERGSAIDEGLNFKDFGHSGWQYFLSEIIDVYVPFLKANAAAWRTDIKGLILSLQQ